MKDKQLRKIIKVMRQHISDPIERARFLLEVPFEVRARQAYAVAGLSILKPEGFDHAVRLIELYADAEIGAAIDTVYEASGVDELCKRLNGAEALLRDAREQRMSFWGQVDRVGVIEGKPFPAFDFEPTMRETFRAWSWGVTTSGKRAAVCRLERGEKTVDVGGAEVLGPCWYLHRLDEEGER